MTARAFITDAAIRSAPGVTIESIERMLAGIPGAASFRDGVRDGVVIEAPLRTCCNLVDLLPPT